MHPVLITENLAKFRLGHHFVIVVCSIRLGVGEDTHDQRRLRAAVD